ncbi:phage tail fiber protein [Rhodococcus rhodochrous]|uniref:phage tail fiber protein n=1 Tax=Rhodococcus pyridinivorans TaxID=103816 RepID=UPI000363A434
MAVGISAANVANHVLNWLRGVAPPAVGGLYVKLHKDDPGAAGTANGSVVTTRRQATMNAAAGGSMSLLSMSGSWAMTASETITHISVHDAASGGNFLFSAALNTPRSVVNGDTITMTTLVVGNTPLAA